MIPKLLKLGEMDQLFASSVLNFALSKNRPTFRPINCTHNRTMSGTFAYGHRAGEQLECFSIPIELVKEKTTDASGAEQEKCGLKIGGGIDQDPKKSPYGYPDTGIYVTHIEPGGPADHAGLMVHDKILQVNGRDFTMVTHEKAIHYIKKYPVLKMLISRAGVTETN